MREETFSRLVERAQDAIHRVRAREIARRKRKCEYTYLLNEVELGAKRVREEARRQRSREQRLRYAEGLLTEEVNKQFAEAVETLQRMYEETVREASVLPSESVRAGVLDSSDKKFRDGLAQVWALVREIEKKYRAKEGLKR